MIAILLVSALVIALALVSYAFRRSVLHYRNEIAGEKRTADDRVSEVRRDLSLAVAGTFVAVRDAVLDPEKHLAKPARAPDESDDAFNARLLAWEEAIHGDLEATFAALAKMQEKDAQTMIAEFREKVAVLNAATMAAQDRVATASREVEAVRAENTLHRTLLERALSLPLDTPPAAKELYLARAMALLTSQRATHDCPNDDVWRMYVDRHAAQYAGQSPVANMNGAKA